MLKKKKLKILWKNIRNMKLKRFQKIIVLKQPIILAITKINFKGYSLELRADEVKHIFKFHANDAYEAQRGQREVVREDVFAFTDVIKDFDYIEPGNRKNSFVFVKRNSKRGNRQVAST